MKFKELSEIWLENKKPYIKLATYALYAYEVSIYLQKEFGNIKINKISEKSFQEMIIDLQINNHMRLSDSTRKNLITLLKQIIRYGQNHNLIKHFDLSITFTRQQHLSSILNTQNRTLTEENAKRLTNYLHQNNDFISFGIMLAIYEGLRIGEVCALKWKDFDLNNNVIYIHQTLQRIYLHSEEAKKTQVIITAPKTKSSVRIIPISNELREMLTKLPIDLDCISGNENFILTNAKRFMEPRALRNYYSNICHKNNIDGLHFHSLRHTFATKCIESGTDCKIVSELLGHSSVTTTLNLYVHPSMKEKARCLNKLKY